MIPVLAPFSAARLDVREDLAGGVALFTATPKAERRFWEFFTAHISNDHTRRAYMNATKRFAECWLRHCSSR